MPRYTVEWCWKIEWVVEATSKDAAHRAAMDDLSAQDQAKWDAGDPVVTVYGERPSSKEGEVHAVVNERLLQNPEDAEEEWDRLVAAEEIQAFEAKSGLLFSEESKP